MADTERTSRRYKRAARAVELAAVALIVAMAAVLMTGTGPWVGAAALALLAAAAIAHIASWPLHRRASEARWQAMEDRWAAVREEQEDDGRG